MVDSLLHIMGHVLYCCKNPSKQNNSSGKPMMEEYYWPIILIDDVARVLLAIL